MRRSGVSALEAPGSEKMLICNAAEGDPDSLIARTLLAEDPHSVLEGMGIGAYATGATLGVIYINAEYGLAIDRLRTALKQAEHHGFLGNPIGGCKARVHIEVREGTGKLACGDETFLINAIEGKQTMPFVCSSRPPLSGLGDKPTLVHSVETWAHVSAILEKGPAWYAGFGTGLSRGTRVFTLSGNVVNPGLIEVALGTPLREIVCMISGEEFQTARHSRRYRSAVPQGVISLSVLWTFRSTMSTCSMPGPLWDRGPFWLWMAMPAWSTGPGAPSLSLKPSRAANVSSAVKARCRWQKSWQT